jgi:DNA (cytosine-5)-methyltransferase 1
MAAYYNEIDPFAAQWLRNLIAAGHIAAGDVDERSIVDVAPSELAGYTQCHFFAGIGVWSHALRLAGWSDDRSVWTGSCPCQPFSAAGKGAGFDDERHLWPAFHHLIEQCRPATVLGEQVASPDGLAWIDLVQTDLENSGYASAAVDLCAAGVGAPHIRQRLYWTAYAERDQQPWKEPCSGASRRVGRKQQPVPWDESWQDALTRLRALDNGVARCVAGTDAARNAIVPQVAQVFIEAVMECIP